MNKKHYPSPADVFVNWAKDLAQDTATPERGEALTLGIQHDPIEVTVEGEPFTLYAERRTVLRSTVTLSFGNAALTFAAAAQWLHEHPTARPVLVESTYSSRTAYERGDMYQLVMTVGWTEKETV